MAMSRSLGSSSLTTRSPIATWPPVMRSSPAIMRSRVDLPQPEGPTMTMNSPSAISASTPWITSVVPYRFKTLRREMLAIVLFFRIDQTFDEPALHADDDKRRRQHREQGGGHDDVPVIGRVAAGDH